MVEFDMRYEGHSVYQDGISNMRSFASNLHDYMQRNFDQESAVEPVKIEGRGPGSRLINIIFLNGKVISQHVELHCDIEEERLKSELLSLYEKSGFKFTQPQP